MDDTPERRQLAFNSLNDAVADVERLVQGKVRTTGKHTFGQIIEHLARTHDMVTGKIVGPKMPWYIRMAMPFMRKKILNGPVTPGFKLPKNVEDFFWEKGDVDVQQALTHLKESVEYYNSNGPLPVHPVFGEATREQIDSLNRQHCAMHLSFVHPV
ncbi:MAG: DUF1569 domain-containing protein [Mariniblastus sp.]